MSFNPIIEKVVKTVSGMGMIKAKDLRAFTKYNSVKKLKNLLLLITELRYRRTRLNSFPILLTVDPTNICNLHCPLCPTGKGEFGRPKGMMKLGEFKGIIDQIGDYLYEVNLYNWGEPLLNKEVFSMVSYAHEHNIFTCISTNLTYLPEENAEALVRSELDHLIVCIDGLDSQTYSKYRVGGDFEQVIENLKRLVDLKRRLRSRFPFIDFLFLCFKHNQHKVDKVERFAKALGADGVTIKRGGLIATELDINPATNMENLNWVVRESLPQISDEGMLSGKKSCDFLWYTLIINWDGGVSPCCYTYKEEDDFDNFFSGSSFREIWNNAKFVAARSLFSEMRLGSRQDVVCNKCYVAKDFIRVKT